MPLFLLGNSTPTIPHQLRQHRRSRFPHGLADAADALGKKGSNVYVLNQWLREFGRGKPHLGGLSVTATEERRIAVAKGGAKKAGPWQSGSEGATRLPRLQDPVAEWNEDNPSISLVQIFEIEMLMSYDISKYLPRSES